MEDDNSDNTIIIKWEHICRVCLSDTMDLYPIHNSEERYNTTFFDMLIYSTSLKISTSDSFPQLICSVCINELQVAFNFKNKCETSESRLLTLQTRKNDADCRNDIKLEEKLRHDLDLLESDDDHFENAINECNESSNVVSEIQTRSTRSRTLNGKISNKTNKSPLSNKLTEETKIKANDKVGNKCTKQYECSGCQLYYESYKDLLEHKKSANHAKIINCRRCNIDFNDRKSYRKHLKIHVNILCPECGKVFNQKAHYRAHMATHSNDKPHLCTICGKKYTSQSSLIAHRRIHSGEKRYGCEYCEQKFIHWSSMKSHIRTYHTKEKRHICHICNKQFSQSSNLTWHIRGHTGEKPYPCTMCDMNFKSTGCLRSHMVKHTGERKAICKICNKGFTKPYNLKLHMVTHTGERKFVCLVCGKAFTQAHVLRGHMRTHPEHSQNVQKATESQM